MAATSDGDDFERELLVDRLEAELGEFVRDHLRGQWNAACTGGGGPGWPSVLEDPEWTTRGVRAQSSADVAVSTRATQLWRLALRLRVYADRAVGHAAARADSEAGSIVLAAARNRVARAAGFAHFAELACAVDEVPMPRGADMVAPTPRRPAPGHADDALAWLASLGVDSSGVRWHYRDGVRPSTFVVDAPNDVRVVVPAPVSAGDWHAFLHEVGHAWLARSHDPSLPWSLRNAPTRLDHEGVAEWVARAADSAAFARAVLGCDAEAAAAWVEERRLARQVRRARRQARALDEWRLYAELEPVRGWSGAARAQLVTDPGAQLLYGAMDQRADQLEAAFGEVTDGAAAAAFVATLGRPGASRAWGFEV